MVKAKWVKAILVGLTMAGWTQAQQPILVPAAKNSTVLRTWQTPDGRRIYEFKDLMTGDHLTVIEEGPVVSSTVSRDKIMPSPAGGPIKPVSSQTLAPMPPSSTAATSVVVTSPSSSTNQVIIEPSKKRSLFSRRRSNQSLPETMMLPPGSAAPTFSEPIVIPESNSTPLPMPKKRSIWNRDPKPEVISLPASSPPPPEAAK